MSLALIAASLFSFSPVGANAGEVISIERFGYVGNWTRYSTLSDAQTGASPVAFGTVPQRDLSLFLTKNAPDIYTDSNYILTLWYNPATGNPNNTNLGFFQIADDPALNSTSGTTDTSFNSYWTDSSLTSFRLQVAGANAGSGQVARFGEVAGGAASTTGGIFHEYELDALFQGLAGSYNAVEDRFEATTDPSSIMGTITAIFENTGTDTPRHGFYAIDLDLNSTSFAFDNGHLDPNSAFFASAVVAPEPTSIALWIIVGVLCLGLGLRSRISLQD